jgi:hypothetical protein
LAGLNLVDLSELSAGLESIEGTTALTERPSMGLTVAISAHDELGVGDKMSDASRREARVKWLTGRPWRVTVHLLGPQLCRKSQA